jgi:hypothetical protein
MGLYIKGAKMPKNCWGCPCYNKEYLICQVTESCCEYEKPNNCPLVELPSKHGRLVDCDALVAKESAQYENVMKDEKRDWLDKILADLIHKTLEVTLTEKNAPTVLEAEGVEDND